MGSTRFNFTQAALQAVTCPPDADRVYVYDVKTPGLAYCITASGAASFYVYRRMDGHPQRYRLGAMHGLTIEQARRRATEVNGEVAAGGNPQAERSRARGSMTLAEMFAHYIETHAKPHKRTWEDDQAQFDRYFGKPDGEPPPFPGWRVRKVNTITEADVQTLHAKLGTKHGPYAANRVLALLSAMFNHCRVDPNPAKRVRKFKEHKRARFLTAEELPRFFKALSEHSDETMRDFFLVALFTGARRSNVQEMRWDEIDFARSVWTIPAAKAKADEMIEVPLSERMLAILADRLKTRPKAKDGKPSPWVFPGYGKTEHITEPKAAWSAILKNAGIADLRIHDLRRTLGSWQAGTGASLPVIGKMLGHRNASTTQIYARLDLDPVRKSLETATAAMIAAGSNEKGVAHAR